MWQKRLIIALVLCNSEILGFKYVVNKYKKFI